MFKESETGLELIFSELCL